MWLVPSSISADFAAVSGCSTSQPASPSNSSATDIALRCCVNGKATPRPVSWHGWKNRAWSQRLFGAAISRTSQRRRFTVWWTCSVLASPVSRGPAPAKVKAPPTNDGSGQPLRTSSATWDRDSCSWRMCRGLFQEADLNMCSVRLPKCGSMRNGFISRQKALALRTSGSECSSWLTPTSND